MIPQSHFRLTISFSRLILINDMTAQWYDKTELSCYTSTNWIHDDPCKMTSDDLPLTISCHLTFFLYSHSFGLSMNPKHKMGRDFKCADESFRGSCYSSWFGLGTANDVVLPWRQMTSRMWFCFPGIECYRPTVILPSRRLPQSLQTRKRSGEMSRMIETLSLWPRAQAWTFAKRSNRDQFWSKREIVWMEHSCLDRSYLDPKRTTLPFMTYSGTMDINSN